MMTTTTETTIREQVEQQARSDAALFVEEFGEPIDTAQTDWDATAWSDVCRELRLTNADAEALWPVYQAELAAETERLTATRNGTTFTTVTECFNRVYRQLREDNGENAPSSYTYFAPTLAELSGPDHADRDLSDKEPYASLVGDADAETVAWAYEVNGFNLFRVTSSASENELATFFGRCMGYDL